MICILSLVIFGVLGIFSVSFRDIAKEAFDCVFRKVTFRPCRTNFDEKMKSTLTAKIFKMSPGFAKIVYKYFEVISWFFVILLVVSLALVVRSGYLLVVYGTCDPEHPEDCIFTPQDYVGEDVECECETEECIHLTIDEACDSESCSCSEGACIN